MSSQPPAVSVVVPSGRGGPYLREAVASVLAQSLQDLELIVVADGCPDGLEDLEGGDPRVRLFRQERRGVSVARNRGLRAARAELVAFLDDDDRMLPGRLAAQHAVMAARAEVGLCHTQFREIDAEGRPGKLGHAREVQYLDLLRGEIHVLMPTTMMRRRLLEEVGAFDSSLQVGEDLEVIYRMARESQLAFLPEVLTEYRRHGENLTGAVGSTAWAVVDLLDKHARLAGALGRAAEAEGARAGLAWVERYRATVELNRARRSWRERDLRRCGQALAAAFRHSPGVTLEDLLGNRLPRRAAAPGAGGSSPAASPR